MRLSIASKKFLSSPDIRALVLDMDGVMVNSEQLWREVEAPVFQSMLSGWTPDLFHEIVGMGVEDVYHHFSKNYGLKQTKKEFLFSCEKVALDIYERRASLAEGLVEFLKEMKENRIPVGLASSSPKRWILRVLKRFDLSDYFASVLSAEEVGNKTKPAPDLYLQSARNLNISPQEGLAIEDSTVGIASAKNAGFFCWGFRNGSNLSQDFSRADGEFSAFGEMRSLKLH